MSNLHICYVFRIGQVGNEIPENAEEIYEKSVKKLISLLYSNPRIYATISFSGLMLEWYEKKHPEVIDVLRDLTNRKQVEILGGGYYDPLFPLLLPVDRLGQIEMLQNVVRRSLGKRPRGMRLPQNAWEPQLVQSFYSNEFEYMLLDSEIISKKQTQANAFNPNIIEDAGKTITIIPVSQKYVPNVNIPMEEYINSLKKLIPGQEPKIICAEITLQNLTELIANNWFYNFIDYTSFEENIKFSNPENFLKSGVKYIKNFIPSNSSIKINDENIYATRNILIKYPECMTLYARSLHTGNLINLLKGDKHRKKSAREKMWKSQNYVPYTNQNNFIGVFERQNAYRILLQAEKSIKEFSNIKTFSIFDYDMDGYKDYIIQYPIYSAFLSPRGAHIIELDLHSSCYNYVGEKRKLFSDFLIEKENASMLDLQSENDLVENTVFQDLIFTEQKIVKSRNEVHLLGEGFFGRQKQAVSLKKTYTFYENGVQVQYILHNNSINRINGIFGVEVNLTMPLCEEPSRKIEIVTDEGKDSPCVNQTYKQSDVSWIQVSDTNLSNEFIFEFNENASINLQPLYMENQMISNCCIFHWDVDIQPGFEIEKTIFLNIKSPGKKSLSKKKK